MTVLRPLDVRLAEARALRDQLDPPPARPEGHGGLTIGLRCPSCGSPWRWVTNDRAPAGTSRERRLVIACTSTSCRWEGSLTVDLADLAAGRDLPRRRVA